MPYLALTSAPLTVPLPRPASRVRPPRSHEVDSTYRLSSSPVSGTVDALPMEKLVSARSSRGAGATYGADAGPGAASFGAAVTQVSGPQGDWPPATAAAELAGASPGACAHAVPLITSSSGGASTSTRCAE